MKKIFYLSFTVLIVLVSISSCKKDEFPIIDNEIVYIPDANFLAALIEQGVDINALGSKGRTPLHAVATIQPITIDTVEERVQKQHELARVLIEHGADVNARDEKGITPYTLAKRNQCATLAEFLKQHGGEE